jgi:two-component system cell cycle response regulator DivK
VSEVLPFLVLLVDDLEDSRVMYAEYLTRSGYRVAQAADGREALAMAHALLPDVVVMDLALPVLDGWETIRQLKGDARTVGILVIALTGHALARHAERARQAGCDALLTKPCVPSTLLALLRDMLATAHPGARVGSIEPRR